MGTITSSQIIICVSLELPNQRTMDEVDFSLSFYVYPDNRVTFTKNELNRIDANNYSALIDTEIIGTGEIYVEASVNLESSLGLRKEIIAQKTGIKTVKNGLC